MNSRKHRLLLKNSIALLLFGGFCLVMLRWWEHRQIYHPSRELEAAGAELGRLFEDVRFAAPDGVELHGWFFPADRSSTRAHLALLICHGNGGNISHRLGLCAALLETGASVFVFDYRGYGQSRGRPSEEGTYRDAQAAHQWLRQRGFKGEQIIAFGESLGGGVASDLALRETLGGVVLQSTFTSIPDIGKELFPWLPVRLIGTIKYDTHSKLPRLQVPVLVIHSREDDLVPFRHAEKNFAVARAPKLFRELRGKHNDALWEQQEFRASVEQLLNLADEAAGGTGS